MNITKDMYDTLKELTGAAMLVDGRECFNPVPKHINTGLTRPLTLREQIQRCLRVELSQQASSQGYETFAENDDFTEDGVDFDDPNIDSRYTVMPDDYPVLGDSPKTVEAASDKTTALPRTEGSVSEDDGATDEKG